MTESRSLVKRDVKDDITKTIQDLQDSVKIELDKLKAEGKLGLATGLHEIEIVLTFLESQLSIINPNTEIGKALLKTVETALEKVKQDLENEIKKLSGSFYADDPIETLLLNVKM